MHTMVINSLQDIPPVKSSISDTSGSVAPSILNLSTAGKFPSSPSIPYPLQLTPSEPQMGHPSSRRWSCIVTCNSTFNVIIVTIGILPIITWHRGSHHMEHLLCYCLLVNNRGRHLTNQHLFQIVPNKFLVSLHVLSKYTNISSTM